MAKKRKKLSEMPDYIQECLSKGKRFSSDNQPKEKWNEENALQLGEQLITWISEETKENIFFEYFLTVDKGLYPELIAYLSGKFSSFLKLVNLAKKIQEMKMVKYGVADKLNASMTKFVLANHHDYKEKKQVESQNVHEVDISKYTADEKKMLLEIARKNKSKE